MTVWAPVPASIEEMRTRLGMRSSCWGSLEDVRKAQSQVADWVIKAAAAAWTGPEFEEQEEAALTFAYLNARVTWPGFDEFCEEITRAERDALRKMKPLA